MKVIYHSADYDGIGSREVFRFFYPALKEADLIGWTHGDKELDIPEDDTVVVVDLAPGSVFGYRPVYPSNIVWIDHHKSAIQAHPEEIRGYRIDGVAACRLAYQWCLRENNHSPLALPKKQEFIDRGVDEPLAIRLLGEYDIWDKRDSRADFLQTGLRTLYESNVDWYRLISESYSEKETKMIVERGIVASIYKENLDGMFMSRAFVCGFDRLRFLALNGRGNSLTFSSIENLKKADRPSYDALMMFYFDGAVYRFSLYRSIHRPDAEILEIALKHGGGGHEGACGFELEKAHFVPSASLDADKILHAFLRPNAS